MLYQMVSRTDEETMRFLNDTIILFVHANPDGHDLVAGWYMRNPVPEKRSGAGLPRLYHHYIGHDNNRDFFASTQKETENINRVLYHEWSPQILYNHHQSGPAGTVFWSPPFRDPFNYNYDPLLVLGLQQLGLTIHARMAAESKPGASMRAAGPYDGWWNGGIRNTAAFHNVMAILTEMIGNPTPMRIPFVLQRQLPTSDLTFPIAPQVWHFRRSIDYSITANRAVLDFASRWRETVLFNVYQMGRNSIARGNTDTWTVQPHRYSAVAAKLGVPTTAGGGGGGANPERDAAVMAAIRDPQFRDPRGYIIPSSQADFLTAVKFINALREVGIRIQRATREFTVNGKAYPAGSFVVMTAQAFRPHIIDMFEPQDHPDNIPFPGAPPTPPYDHAGWTLAFQMGVEFDRILDPFGGPFEAVTDWNVKPPAGNVTTVAKTAGYLIEHRLVDSFVALNRLLKAGEDAYWLRAPLTAEGRTYPAGTWYIVAKGSTRAALEKTAAGLGVSATATAMARPAGAAKLRTPRVGLWDQYGGSMDSGWARWILEQYEFPFERVFPPDIDAGNLHAKFDAIVFVDGAIPSGATQAGAAHPAAADIPAEFRPMLGRMSVERSIPELRRFAEAGGTLITIGSSSSNLIAHLQLPIGNHLQEGGQPLPPAKFYTPGSIVTARVDVSHPVAHGMKERTDLFFDDSPVFRVGAAGENAGVKVLASFDGASPLKSGWSWGQSYLQNGAAAVEAPIGRGRALLFGTEIMKRAQPHGTFKFLFNGLYYAAAEPAPAISGSKAWSGVPPPTGLGDPHRPILDVSALTLAPAVVPPGEEGHRELTGLAIRKHLEAIVGIAVADRARGEKAWGRITGFRGADETHAWVLQQFKAAGLRDVATQTYAGTQAVWHPRSWHVKLASGGDSIVLASAFPTSGSQLAAPIKAPLIMIGATTDPLPDVDVTGRVAVQTLHPAAGAYSERTRTTDRARELAKRGALAVLNVVEQAGNMHVRDFSNCGVPCFNLGHDDGRFLKAVMARATDGNDVRVEIDLATEMREGLKGHNTIGVVPGRRDAELVIVNAHADGWFDAAGDNGDGLAVLIALARHFARPEHQPERSLFFVASGGHHGPGLNGPSNLVKMNPRLAKAVLVLNLEHIAQLQFRNDPFRVEAAEQPMGFGISNEAPAIADIAKRGMERYGFALRPVFTSSIAGDLGGYAPLGVPRVQAIHSGPMYHTSGDTLDTISTPGLERAARFYAFFVNEIAKTERIALQSK